MPQTQRPVGVIGVGYVGLVTAVCIAHLGHHVVCLDVDEAKIEALRAGAVPIYEPGLDELIAGARDRLRSRPPTTSCCERSASCSSPSTRRRRRRATPTCRASSGSCATSRPRRRAAARHEEHRAGGHRRRVVRRARRAGAAAIGYVSNPEFLKEGAAVDGLAAPGPRRDRRLPRGRRRAVGGSYAPLEAPVVRTSVPTAEMIKYASNAFLATKISFINEIANVCEEIGADVRGRADGMGLDHRIGAAFLRPGIGYGGSCFPKDVSALKQLAGNSGYHFQLLNAVIEVNELQKRRVIGKLRAARRSLARQARRAARAGLQAEHRRHARGRLARAGRAAAGRGRPCRAYDPVVAEAGPQAMPGRRDRRERARGALRRRRRGRAGDRVARVRRARLGAGRASA